MASKLQLSARLHKYFCCCLGILQPPVAHSNSEGLAPVSAFHDVWLPAKQRASVRWLLSKAYGHQVPEDLKEPFYRDFEDQEYLKPSVVHALANAELYCLALAHIYADPNYSQLNHWGVIQALARKGVYVAEPSDVALTETTLIHTSPLRMSAHMAVMEGIMGLFVKEVVTAERVVSAVRRFAELDGNDPNPPKDAEEALLLWINKACRALKRRIMDETKGNEGNIPSFPELRELADIGDGVCLAALITLYCPDFMEWTRIALNEPFSMADCLYNLQLVQAFCSETLPYSVLHLSLEDLVYMHSSVRQNVMAFLADLFYIFEVRPAKCIKQPGRVPEPLPEGVKSNVVRRQGSLQEKDKSKRQTVHEGFHSSGSAFGPYVRRKDANEETNDRRTDEFVVHRGKTVPTLYNVSDSVASRPRSEKEKLSSEAKVEEKGEERAAYIPAGVPSNWEERKQSFSGRRSRRNSITDDSHLTIENFGGSQENLSLFGRNPDKQPVTLHVGRRPSSDSPSIDMARVATPSNMNSWKRTTERARSQENLSDFLFVDNRDNDEQERRSRTSSPYSSISSSAKSNTNGKSIVIIANPSNVSNAADIYEEAKVNLSKATNFAELSKLRETLGNSGINIVYMQQDKESLQERNAGSSPAPLQRKSDRKQSGITIAEATSWEPQILDTAISCAGGTPEDMDTTELYSIRLKMEEKRKRIEAEKRQQEFMATKQREKVGKAAFLQAVVKGKGSASGNSSPNPDLSAGIDTSPSIDSPSRSNPMLTPDSDSVSYEYHRNVAPMNETLQHRSMQSGMGYDPYRSVHTTNGMSTEQQPSQQQQQFYLHEPSPSRRTWGQPQPIPTLPITSQQLPHQTVAYGQPIENVYGTMSLRRAQWGTPQPMRPIMSHGYMIPNTTQYMEPPGYMMTPPRHPDTYDSTPHYFADGTQFQEHGDPYYYSPGRQFNMQQQSSPYPINVAAVPPNYMSTTPQIANAANYSPAAAPVVSAANYPSAADQRAPFRLHAETETTKTPVPKNMVPQQQQQSRSEHSDQRLQASPAVQENRSQSAKESPGMKPVPAARTVTQTPSRNETRGSSGASGTSPGTVAALHTAVPTPSIDDMEPQNVSFIETQPGLDETDKLPRRLRNLNITSGNRTYRIPHEGLSSPPRPALTKTFNLSQSPVTVAKSPSPNPPVTVNTNEEMSNEENLADVKTVKLKEDVEADRGFIITFDDVSGPKRPKPQLGVKRQQASPKKSFSSVSTASSEYVSSPNNRETRESSPRRSLSSLARESRDDCSPFTPDSRDSGFGHNSQEELKLFTLATATPGSLPNRSYDSQDDDSGNTGMGLVIGDELLNPDPVTLDEMERKKEKILMQSLKRKQQQEELRQRKEQEAQKRKEEERFKEEEKLRKKEEEKARRAIILEQYKVKKAMEEAEKEGRPFEMPEPVVAKGVPRLRSKSNTTTPRPRPKTIHIDATTVEIGKSLASSKGKRGSGTNLTDSPSRYRTPERGHSGRKDSSVTRYGQSGGSTRNSREDLYGSRGGFHGSNSSLNDETFESYHTTLVHSGRKGSNFMAGPGSLPPGLVSKRRGFDDGASDISSTPSNAVDYIGPKLYKQPAARSNRSIILNAVEYCVFPGVVNREAKQRVLEEITRSESKNFLILFRDGGCQFRALYSYNAEREEVIKLYGTGPKQITDNMFEKFFKYNSGGKCFSQVHTKHLTVTIDAFTIHASLWQGKKATLPNRKDMTLVI